MTYTPYNAPLLSGLLGDHEIAAQFSVKAELSAMIRFEVALAKAQADQGLISKDAANAIAKGLDNFEPDLGELGSGTAQDGLPVPALIRQMRDHIGEPHGADLHKGTTSQDVIDTSLMLRLSMVTAAYRKRFDGIFSKLNQIVKEYGGKPSMARTRMQRALPVTVADKISMWRAPLEDLSNRVPEEFPLQLGGPEGALAGMGENPQAIAETLAQDLGLRWNGRHWQTDRSPLIDYLTWLTKLTTALGKLGQDVVLLSQNEVAEIVLTGGGGSSAMAHKNNPVLAESLVTLARFNAIQMGGMHQAALHEYERSGAAWSLEWMLVSQMCVATGAALRNTDRLLDQITFQ